MASLDPNIILSGVDTTHPTIAMTPLSAEAQGAGIQETNAQTGLLTQQSQKIGLENQLTQQQLQNTMISSKAIINVMRGIGAGSTANAATSTPSSPGATGAVPSATGAAATPSGGSTGSLPNGGNNLASIPVNAPSSAAMPGTIDPKAPPAPQGVDPRAWSYAQEHGYTIDTAHDWYVGADGSPINHTAGPLITPGGRPNMASPAAQDAVADQMEQLGAPAQAIVAFRLDAAAKAAAVDKSFADLYQSNQTGNEAKAKAAQADAETNKIRVSALADTADADLKSPNPVASFFQSYTMTPRAWAPQLLALGIKSPTDVVDPNNAPKILQMLKGMQQQSPNFQAQQEIAIKSRQANIEQQNANQNAWHPVTGVDAQGNPVTELIKPGVNGVPQIQSTNLTPAGYYSPGSVKAQAADIIAGNAPLPPANSRNPGAAQIRAEVYNQQPNFDVTVFPTKQKAVNDFNTGPDGTLLATAETAYQHGELVKQLAAVAKPDGTLPDIPIVNSVKNALSRAAGGAPVNNLNDAINLYATEQAKFINGGKEASVDAVKAQRDNLNSSFSGGSIAGVVATNQALAVDKAATLKNKFLAAMPNNPTAQAAAEVEFARKIPNIGPILSSQGNASQASATISNARLPGQDVVTDSNGVQWKYNGSGDRTSQSNYTKITGQ
jgi:hypothetical protein